MRNDFSIPYGRSDFSKEYGRGKHSIGVVVMLQKCHAGAYGMFYRETFVPVEEVCLYDREAGGLRSKGECSKDLVVVAHPEYGAVAVCGNHKWMVMGGKGRHTQNGK